MKISDLTKKEEAGEFLQNGIDIIKSIIDEHFSDIQENYNKDFKLMEKTIKNNILSEEDKYKRIEQDIIELKAKMETDVELRLEEIDSLRNAREKKNNESPGLLSGSGFGRPGAVPRVRRGHPAADPVLDQSGC